MEGGFHGRTMGALSATPQESKQAPFAPLVPGFTVVPRNDADALAAAVTDDTAAVLLEPIQGESGIHPLDPEVLRAAREACDEHGALLIFDEIQCGMGRTGTLWAHEQLGVAPDVMTVAKGLGGGLPVGACVDQPGRRRRARPGRPRLHLRGRPRDRSGRQRGAGRGDGRRLPRPVRARGERLAAGLRELGLEPRGLGLMVGFDLPDAPDVARRLLLEQRLVVHATGPGTIRMLPPLTVSDDELDEAVRRLGAGLH